MVVFEHACGVVQHITIHLAQRDYGLQRVSHGTLSSDEIGNIIGQRAPSKLCASMSAMSLLGMLVTDTYCGDCLHTQHEGV